MRSLLLKKWIAAVLAACMVMTNLLPVFAEPAFEMSEASEDIFTAETGEITEVEEVAEVSVTEKDLNEAALSDADRTKEQNAAKLLGADPDRVTVTYVDETGEIKSAECILMSGTEAVDSYTFEAGEWYVVRGTFVVKKRIVNNAPEGNPAHLILDSGCELQVRKGIGNIAGKELIIYGHDAAEYESSVLTTYYKNESGNEVSEVDYLNDGIGGNGSDLSGTLTINGGKIRVRGGGNAAGIGCGQNGPGEDTSITAGEIIINDGIVIAEGSADAAGIGGGWKGGRISTLTINGGTVTAIGGKTAPGIGQGHDGTGLATVVINGGTITATGGEWAAGIGNADPIQINGGKVTANGGDRAAGIGGGSWGNAGTIAITGGKVTANGGGTAAGIGGGANGGSGTVTITGGDVTAYGHDGAAGIGGGGTASYGDGGGNGSDVTVTGGRVEIFGGVKGIGGGKDCESDGKTNIDEDVLQIAAGTKKENAVKQSLDEYLQTRSPYVLVDSVKNYYQVEHRYQTADGSSYDVREIETVYARPGSMTKASGKAYSGFTAETFEQKTVADDNSTVVVINYNRNTYTIEFDVIGHGTAPAPINALYGAQVNGPDPPEDPEYHFDGWYKDEAFTKPFVFETMPLNGATAYAKWSPTVEITWMDENTILRKDRVVIGTIPEYGENPAKTGFIFTGWTPALEIAVKDAAYTAVFWRTIEGYHVVNFDSKGGTSVPAVLVEEGKTVTKPADPVKEGYTFDGWYEDESFAKAFDFTKAILADTTVYAKWKENVKPEYTVTWKTDTGEVIDTTQVTEGEMPAHAVAEKEGYIFIGWDPALSPVNADITYTAKFIEKAKDQAAVEFNTAGGSFISTQIIIKGKTAVKPADPVKEGYLFEGWYTDNGFGTVFDFTKAILADTTVYAKWKENVKPKHTVTWKTDTGEVIDTTPVTEGEMPVHADAEKEGYIFTGWTPTLSPVKADITYTAKFIEKTKEIAAVKFDTNGGNFIDIQVVVKGQTAEKPEDPEKSGYVFDGWYADESLSTAFDFAKAVYEDTVVYAKWKQESGKTYTILWKDYDGKELAAAAVAEGRLPKYPNAKPVRSGYIFTGWDKDIALAYSDAVYTAVYAKQTIGGGGGGSTVLGKQTVPTFSPNWYSDERGVWRIRNSVGETVANAWLCDDVIKANGRNVWYLLAQDGAMLAVGLVQDNTGNYYSLETEHNGYFGMLRYEDGYYNCGGQTVYLTFNREHNGAFGAVTNADGLEKLKAIYGVKRYEIGNENAVYTAAF